MEKLTNNVPRLGDFKMHLFPFLDNGITRLPQISPHYCVSFYMFNDNFTKDGFVKT